MRVLTRLRTVFQGNVNTMLDKLEDPIKGLEVIVDDMRKEIADAKKKVAAAISQEKSFKIELNEAEESLNKWNEKAKTAVKADRDDLAREALKEKGKAETKIPQLKSHWEHFKKECDRLKEELKLMEGKFEETLAKKEVMVAKAKVANARSSMANSPPSSLNTEENQQAFSRANGKIRQMEADAAAAKEMSDTFRSSNEKFDELERLQKESNVDDELAKLKEKISK